MTDYEPTLHLISFDTCPYVERSRIVLGEKDLAYKLTLIDLADKPDWFLEISPRGKVPVLLVDDHPIFESAVINEFLDEAFPEPPMFSDDVLLRAQDRAWVVFCNDVLMPAYAKLWFAKAGQDERVAEAKEEIVNALGKIEKRLESRESGPYFSGEAFGLVDVVFAPIFTRREAGKKMFGDFDGNFPQWNKYGSNLLKRDSVQDAKADELTEKMGAMFEKLQAA